MDYSIRMLIGRDYNEHDYPEFSHLENGNYENHCVECGEEFIGCKGMPLCKVCRENPDGWEGK